jgi:YHS domain-containing protein
MQVAKNTEKTARFQGVAYYFCSQSCVSKFTAAPENYVKAKRVIGMGSVPAASAASTSAPVTTANVAAAAPVVREVSRVKPAGGNSCCGGSHAATKVCNTTRKARIKIRSAG